ncbi:MAG: glycosyltransferase [Candidatus Helarchaeota archaeon]
MNKNSIIILSTSPWNGLWTRKQRFAKFFSKNHKVIYVEPITSFFSPFKKDSFYKFQLFSKIKKTDNNLFVLTPHLGLPFRRFITIKKINIFLLKRTIKKCLKKMNINSFIMITYNPYSDNIISELRPILSIFDCVDDHSEYPYPALKKKRNKDYLITKENNLCNIVDIVITTSKELYKKKKIINQNTYFIPNGVDFHVFQKYFFEKNEIPEDLKNVKKPIIGFVGGLAQWIDFELIKYIAKESPDWSVVLVGPIIGNLNIINIKNEYKNIYFLGKKEKEDIPKYVSNFDVCINPFKINKLSKHVNPLKVYEYLAAMKPVVSVKMPELESLSDIIHFADSKFDFVEKISTTLQSPDKIDKQKVTEIIKQFDWRNLFNKYNLTIQTRIK